MANESKLPSLYSLAAKGDRQAFEQIYRLTGRQVYYTALKLTASEDIAQDILQDTFLTAWQTLDKLQSHDRLQSWLTGIAINKCRRFFRAGSEVSLDEELTENGLQLADDNALIPEDYVTDTHKQQTVLDIINTLPAQQRQTVILFYYNEMTVAEIAAAMGCPEGTVKYRLSAAREKIREAVLIYESEHNDKLHAAVPIPVLTRILRCEQDRVQLPKLDIASLLNTQGSASAARNTIIQNGGKTMEKALLTKIIAGAAAAVLVIGGIAVAVTSGDDDEGSSRKTKKSSSSGITSSVIDESTAEESAPAESQEPAVTTLKPDETALPETTTTTTTTTAEPEPEPEEPAKNLVEPQDIQYLPWLTAGALKFDYPSHFEYDINTDYLKLEYAKNEFVQGFVHNTKGHAVFAFDCKIGDADRFLYMWYLDVDDDTPKAATNEEAYTRSEPLLLAEIKSEYGTLDDECEISIDSKETIHLDAVPVYSNIRSEYDYDFIKGTVTVHAEDGDHLVHFSGAFGALEEAIRASTTVNDIPLMLLTFAETDDEYTLQYLDTVIQHAMENMGRS